MKQSITILDDFYTDPWEVRKLASTADYGLPGTYAGRDSQAFGQMSTMEYFGNILQDKLFWLTEQGRFRLSLESDTTKSASHFDVEYENLHFLRENPTWEPYTAVIYLSKPDIDEKSSLQFTRHKETGLEEVIFPHQMAREEHDNHDAWEVVYEIPHKFNRCILFRGRQFHNVTKPYGFGKDFDTGRLIQTFFFYKGFNPKFHS